VCHGRAANAAARRGVLLKSLSFDEPDRLVGIYRAARLNPVEALRTDR
jgi:hypothetical protein